MRQLCCVPLISIELHCSVKSVKEVPDGSPSTAAHSPASLTDSELLKTPPKRKTARKHTGRVPLDLSHVATLSSGSQASVSNGATTGPPAKKQKTASEDEKLVPGDVRCDTSSGETGEAGERGEEGEEGAVRNVGEEKGEGGGKREEGRVEVGGAVSEKEGDVGTVLKELSGKPREDEGVEGEQGGKGHEGGEEGGVEGKDGEEMEVGEEDAGQPCGSESVNTTCEGAATPVSAKKKAMHPFFGEYDIGTAQNDTTCILYMYRLSPTF